MKDIEEQERIIKRVIDCAYAVRTQLQQGYEEKIYRNAMCLEMQKRGVEFKIEVPYNVYYDDQVVGQYRIDLLIEPIKPQFNKIAMYKTTNYTNYTN